MMMSYEGFHTRANNPTTCLVFFDSLARRLHRKHGWESLAMNDHTFLVIKSFAIIFFYVSNCSLLSGCVKSVCVWDTGNE